jgi:two-component system nitrogen regulation sensor histidine kinase GlnL
MDALYKHILDHQSTAVVLVDHDLRVSWLNQAAEFLLATSATRSAGDPVRTVIRNGEEFEAQLREALAAEQSFTKRQAELHLPATDQGISVDVTVTPVSVSEFRGLLIELQHLDRLLRINREAAQLNAQQTTRGLVRGMAHEIKNPLGGIRGAAQLLSRELDAPGLQDYTNVIIEEADRLRNLVDRMLGPNRMPQRRPANIHRILERVRTLLEAEQPGRVHFERDYDPSIPELECDDEQIVQAVLNVARNAVQALEQTPEARIVLRTRPVRQVTIGHARYRLAVRIDIVDNGPGVPEELEERLFYPMISGRPEGTGLGLSIAQSIVSQHGGLVECESRPGETRFTFLLPLEASTTEPTDEAS